jgi:hypothetical protein
VTTELATTSSEELITNPFTGEAIDLNADTEVLARAVRSLRDLDDERKAVVKTLSRELLKRMDANAKWTMHFAGLDVTSVAPGKVEYNGEKLKEVLEGLVKDKLITREAALEAIDRKVTYSAKVRGVNALKKLGGDVAKRIRSAEARIPDEKRSVAVKVKEGVIDGGEISPEAAS